MRTTIRREDTLLAEIQQPAARTDTRLTSVAEYALREMLARQQEEEGRAPVSLPAASGDGLQLGLQPFPQAVVATPDRQRLPLRIMTGCREPFGRWSCL